MIHPLRVPRLLWQFYDFIFIVCHSHCAFIGNINWKIVKGVSWTILKNKYKFTWLIVKNHTLWHINHFDWLVCKRWLIYLHKGYGVQLWLVGFYGCCFTSQSRWLAFHSYQVNWHTSYTPLLTWIILLAASYRFLRILPILRRCRKRLSYLC